LKYIIENRQYRILGLKYSGEKGKKTLTASGEVVRISGDAGLKRLEVFDYICLLLITQVQADEL